jgi:hypothetical protein
MNCRVLRRSGNKFYKILVIHKGLSILKSSDNCVLYSRLTSFWTSLLHPLCNTVKGYNISGTVSVFALKWSSKEVPTQ